MYIFRPLITKFFKSFLQTIFVFTHYTNKGYKKRILLLLPVFFFLFV